jgi:uncharacterized SAM-binding protein YcdF (DUF218 family)
LPCHGNRQQQKRISTREGASFVSRPWVRKLTITAAILTGLLSILYVARFQIVQRIGSFLVIDDMRDQADAIILLNGGLSHRPAHAAKLMARHMAGKMIIARAEDSVNVEMGSSSNSTDLSISLMKKHGVNPADIIEIRVPGGVTSTFEEGRVLRDYLLEHPMDRIIVVTTAMHTRRARWVMSRALSGLPVEIQMSAVPDPRYAVRNWWATEEGFLSCQNEYLKLAYYAWRY